jgi:putative DNA primase/helicase
MSDTSYEQVREALGYVPAHDRNTWLRIGMAVKSELGEDGFSVWDEWSQGDETYNERDAKGAWKSIRPAGKVTIGTLFYEAKRHGWRGEKSGGNGHVLSETERVEREQRRRAEQEAEAQRREEAQSEAAEIWDSSKPAPEDHPYLARKGVRPHGVRI